MSRLSERARRVALALLAVALVGCHNCDNACKEGITFNVAEVAGALSRGGQVPLHICFDGECQDVTITRDNAAGSVFLPFSGVCKAGDHHLAVTSTSALKGDYTGPITSFVQDPGGDCKTCALATVKVGADGTLTPGVPAPQASTTTGDAPVPPASGVTTPAAG